MWVWLVWSKTRRRIDQTPFHSSRYSTELNSNILFELSLPPYTCEGDGVWAGALRSMNVRTTPRLAVSTTSMSVIV